MFGFAGFMIIFNTFKWGHDKEEKGERTDFRGRPNNNMPDEDMD